MLANQGEVNRMRFLMALGAVIGFLTGVFFGLAAHSDGSAVFWRSSVAALAAGILMRWWGRMWVRSWKNALNEKLNALERERQEPKPSIAGKA
jgi:hypothetical protein